MALTLIKSLIKVISSNFINYFNTTNGMTLRAIACGPSDPSSNPRVGLLCRILELFTRKKIKIKLFSDVHWLCLSKMLESFVAKILSKKLIY